MSNPQNYPFHETGNFLSHFMKESTVSPISWNHNRLAHFMKQAWCKVWLYRSLLLNPQNYPFHETGNCLAHFIKQMTDFKCFKYRIFFLLHSQEPLFIFVNSTKSKYNINTMSCVFDQTRGPECLILLDYMIIFQSPSELSHHRLILKTSTLPYRIQVALVAYLDHLARHCVESDLKFLFLL